MTIDDPWDEAIRRHDRRVYLSVLSLGLTPERSREIAQAAWTRLIEQHARGALGELELPGLAIRQARFLALNELKRTKLEARTLAAVPDPPASPDAERVVGNREEIDLGKLIAPEPRDRFANATAALEALERAANGVVEAPAPTKARKRDAGGGWRPLVLAAAALALVGVGAAGFTILHRLRGGSEDTAGVMTVRTGVDTEQRDSGEGPRIAPPMELDKFRIHEDT